MALVKKVRDDALTQNVCEKCSGGSARSSALSIVKSGKLTSRWPRSRRISSASRGKATQRMRPCLPGK